MEAWSHPLVALPLLVALLLLLTFRCSMCHTQAPSRGADAPADDARGSIVDATLEELTAVDPATAAVLQDAKAPL